jgi:hypothetical protein
MNESMIEQRKDKRHELVLEVTEISDQPDKHAFTVDISVNGARLETDHPVKLNEIIEICLGQKLPKLACKAVWVTEKSVDPPSYYVGIEFLEPFSFCTNILALWSEYQHDIQNFKGRIIELREELDHTKKQQSWWHRLLAGD